MREAVRARLDGIAWTTGAQQAERYPGARSAWHATLYDRILPRQAARFAGAWGAGPEPMTAHAPAGDALVELAQRLAPPDESGREMDVGDGMVADRRFLRDRRRLEVPVKQSLVRRTGIKQRQAPLPETELGGAVAGRARRMRYPSERAHNGAPRTLQRNSERLVERKRR